MSEIGELIMFQINKISQLITIIYLHPNCSVHLGICLSIIIRQGVFGHSSRMSTQVKVQNLIKEN